MKRLLWLMAIAVMSCQKDDAPVKPVTTVTFTGVSTTRVVDRYSLAATYAITPTTLVAIQTGFIFGDTQDLASATRITLTNNGGNLISTITPSLSFGKTYYYKPFVNLADGKEYAGDLQSFTTPTITATMTPLIAGRGQKVTVQGDFQTDNKDDVKVMVGSTAANITSFSRTKLEFMVPEGISMDVTYGMSMTIGSAGVAIAEKLKVSHWSVMSAVSQNFFKSFYATTQSGADFFLNGTQCLFNGSGVFMYDRTTDTWGNGLGLAGNPAAPTVISDPAFFTLFGKGYLTMGTVPSTTTVYELNTSGTQWQTIGTSPVIPATYNGVFTSNEAYGHYGYYGLGLDANKNAIRSLWRFSSDNTWLQSTSPYPGQPISYGVAFVISDFVLVGGGLDFTTTPPGINHDFYSYTFGGGNIWVKRADFPDIQVSRGFVFNDKGYVLGVDGSIWIYEFAGSWHKSADKIPNTTIRYNPHVWVAGDYIFIAGGTMPDGTQLNDSYRWDPRP